jgi:hypothetical protein
MYLTEYLFNFQFQIGFQVPSSKLEKSHELKTQNENIYQTSLICLRVLSFIFFSLFTEEQFLKL